MPHRANQDIDRLVAVLLDEQGNILRVEEPIDCGSSSHGPRLSLGT